MMQLGYYVSLQKTVCRCSISRYVRKSLGIGTEGDKTAKWV
jgi:hypothetical protein